MKDGSLKFAYEFVKGKIVDHKLLLNANLETVYERMFSQLRGKLAEQPENIENGILILIIGCFWLESLLNENLKFCLTHEIKNKKFGKLIWENIKRLNFLQKLNMLSLFTNPELLNEYTNSKKEWLFRRICG